MAGRCAAGAAAGARALAGVRPPLILRLQMGGGGGGERNRGAVPRRPHCLSLTLLISVCTVQPRRTSSDDIDTAREQDKTDIHWKLIGRVSAGPDTFALS